MPGAGFDVTLSYYAHLMPEAGGNRRITTASLDCKVETLDGFG